MSAYIPDDILANVLLRLPIDFLLRCRSVSKSWRALIDSPDFVRMHFKKPLNPKSEDLKIVAMSDEGTFSILEFDSKDCSIASAKLLNCPLNDPESMIDFAGSCNGLLCLTSSNEGIVLWNPLIQKHLELPSPPIEYSMGGKAQVSSRLGFGYDHINDDYKIVNFMRFRGDLSDIFEEACAFPQEVYVYSLKLNSWRKIGDFPRAFAEHASDVGAFANGALHWIVKKRQRDVVNFILLFNLRKEEFSEMPCPRDRNDVFQQNLRILNGNLCLLSYYYSAGRYRVDLSVMKEYGVEESWTKLTSIKMPYANFTLWNLSPITYLKNGRELVLQIEGDNKLVVYDLLTKFIDYVTIDGSDTRNTHSSCVCLGSLLRPHGEGMD